MKFQNENGCALISCIFYVLFTNNVITNVPNTPEIMVLILFEGSETKDATKTREEGKDNQPTPVLVKDCYETSSETFICMALHQTC